MSRDRNVRRLNGVGYVPKPTNIDRTKRRGNTQSAPTPNKIKFSKPNELILKNNHFFTKTVSIIISYKESTDERKGNILKVISFISRLLSENIEMIIVEQDSESKIDWLDEMDNSKYINHVFLKNDSIFNKGWGNNVGGMYAKGEYLIFNDSDVLVSYQTYLDSINLLNDCDVINPYKHIYWLNELETSEFIPEEVNCKINLTRVLFTPTVITGGIFLIKKEVFIKIKGFDVNSYGWGYQDYIFDEKIKKLDLNIKSIKSIAIHLNHAGNPKPYSGNVRNDDIYFKFIERNKKIYESYIKMSKSDVLEKINNTVLCSGETYSNNFISVVMSYYNRKQHLINTLWSIKNSTFKDIEVIVVDDGSDEEDRIEDLMEIFKFLKVIRINKNDKKHNNPCIPLNIGLSKTIGNIIIIQNPECFHYDDIIQHVNDNIKKNQYLAYSTINKDVVELLKHVDWDSEFKSKISHLKEFDQGDTWYCHSKYRPEAFNFCCAIMRTDLIDLNGFDERYSCGIERDDVEFLTRIKRKKMDIIFVDDMLVIHQNHVKFYYAQENANMLRKVNHKLYAKTTAKETNIKANPNKTIIA